MNSQWIPTCLLIFMLWVEYRDRRALRNKYRALLRAVFEVIERIGDDPMAELCEAVNDLDKSGEL